jgi:3-oxoacyl-[acyl-carrier protein] reductase
VIQLDLAHESSVRQAAVQAHDALGRIDAWVNNAGADILTNHGASLSTMEKLDLLIAVDLRGTMIASWQAATLMAQQDGGGVIVNMSWDHAISGMSGLDPQLFSAVKGGVLSFSKSLARSVGPNVRVNILAPGWIETAFGKDASEAMRRRVAESTPLRRWGCPEDVAAAAVFLASPSAAFITGQTIMVNGGVVM